MEAGIAAIDLDGRLGGPEAAPARPRPAADGHEKPSLHPTEYAAHVVAEVPSGNVFHVGDRTSLLRAPRRSRMARRRSLLVGPWAHEKPGCRPGSPFLTVRRPWIPRGRQGFLLIGVDLGLDTKGGVRDSFLLGA
jgi:hypothetical protein